MEHVHKEHEIFGCGFQYNVPETWCNRGKSGYYAEEANGSDEMNKIKFTHVWDKLRDPEFILMRICMNNNNMITDRFTMAKIP